MASISKENIDKWFHNNVDLTTRTIYMGSIENNEGTESGVDAFMAESVIKAMHVLEIKNNDPITILMNNPGGDFFHGLAIYDVIKNAKSHCTIKVYGYAMSMGSLILQAADHRIMMPNSRFMIHYGYDSKDDNTKNVIRWVDESKRLCRLMEDIYLDNIIEKGNKEQPGYLEKTLSRIMTKLHEMDINNTEVFDYKFSSRPLTKREEIRLILKRMLEFDTILTAEETVSIGLADEVYKP